MKKAKFGMISDGEGESGVRANMETLPDMSPEHQAPEATIDPRRDIPGPKIKERENAKKDFPLYDRDSAKEKLSDIHEFIASKKEDDVVRDHKIHRQHYYTLKELVKNNLPLSDGHCEMIHNIHSKLKASGSL